MDPGTELIIFQRLFAMLTDQCVVSALHRLHLVRLFDYVYVMKEGQIVEEGTFDELCHNGGEFSRLWANFEAKQREDSEENGLPL